MELLGWYGARLALLDNECGHSLGDGIPDVAGFVDHALRVVVSLACRNAARLLPFYPKFKCALKHGCVFISGVRVTASGGTRREFDGK